MAKISAEKQPEFIAKAKKRWQVIDDYESDQRDEMLDDSKFSVADNDWQWLSDDVTARKASNRPFITVDRTSQFTDNVKNNYRQQNPAIKISPTDEGEQEKIAERRQGLVRHISYTSKAQMARTQAFDDSVTMGRGHYLVKTEYLPDSFNQIITEEPINDPLSVYCDIRRKKPDYSDCEWGFILTPHLREEFEDMYPDASVAGWSGGKDVVWATETTVTVAEYYLKHPVKRTLLKVEEDGLTRTLYKDELEDVKYKEIKSKVIEEREVDDREWWYYKLIDDDILEQRKLPFKEFPIITFIGQETVVDGELSLRGLLRKIKQLGRLYNFVTSQIAELISLAPKTRYIAAEGQLEDYENEWANANTTANPTLTYKPKTHEGQLLPPPHLKKKCLPLKLC